MRRPRLPAAQVGLSIRTGEACGTGVDVTDGFPDTALESLH
ncbi:MAG: hypothetical protein R3C49_27785 [Planctomycetaceae bacterium]